MAPLCPATQQRCFTKNLGMEHSTVGSEMAPSSAEGLGRLVPTCPACRVGQTLPHQEGGV